MDLKRLHNDIHEGALQLIAEHREQLFAKAKSICGNVDDADELVIRTIDRAIRKVNTYAGEGDILSWMMTIMVNIHNHDCRNPVVRGTTAVSDDELEKYAGADWSTDDEILRNSDREILFEVLRRLDPVDRKAVLMRYYDGFTLKEIANILNKPVSTVGRRIQIALRLLAGKLGAKMNKTGKPLAVILVAFLSLVSAAAVATLPAFEPLRATVAGWFGSDSAAEEGIRGVGVSPAQVEDGFAPDDGELGRVGVPPPTAPVPAIAISNEQESHETQLQETQSQEKQTMKLAQTFAAAALAVTAAVVTVEADGVTLESVQARQRYPWNGLVDIDYTITYDNGATLGVDDNLEVLLVDHDVEPAVTNRAITFLQAPLPMTEGSHRITWDANADKVTNRIDKAEFIIQLKHYSEAYMVIDVSGGSETNCYPVDFLNGAPPNGFTDPEYKGNKIVLRRIHPGSYMAGSPDNEANRIAAREKQHRVALSQPFYIGIYEVTQKQYENVTGAKPSTYKGDYRPVEKVSYDTIRGGNWPTTADPGANTFMDMLIRKCKAKGSDGNYTEPVEGFDLPTEFQWEYACHAGTTGAFNTTNAYNNANSGEQEAQLMLLGRYKSNQTDGKGGYDANHTVVGSYQPNQWGLYDMHGNVLEWCRDWYQEDVAALKQFTDPKGAASGSYRARRGGSWSGTVGDCRSAYRRDEGASSFALAYIGFRLSRTLP